MSVLYLHSVFSSPATILHTHSLVQTRPSKGRFVVSSTHSNSKILKSNRKSRYGKLLSLYDDDSEEEEEEEDDVAEDDWLADDYVSSLEVSIFFKHAFWKCYQSCFISCLNFGFQSKRIIYFVMSDSWLFYPMFLNMPFAQIAVNMDNLLASIELI